MKVFEKKEVESLDNECSTLFACDCASAPEIEMKHSEVKSKCFEVMKMFFGFWDGGKVNTYLDSFQLMKMQRFKQRM